MNAYVALAPVIDYIAPSPAVFSTFSQQLPPADCNEAFAVEASAPQDVGSLPSLDEQIVDIPIPRAVEEIEDMSVQINDCIQTLNISKENVTKLEEVTSSLRTRLQVLTKSPGPDKLHDRHKVNWILSSRSYTKSSNLFLTRSSFSLKRCVKNNIS